jgi:hypothetical protein
MVAIGCFVHVQEFDEKSRGHHFEKFIAAKGRYQ